MSHLTLRSIVGLILSTCLGFSQADIHDIAPGLLNALLTKMESAGTAEKVAENDHLMNCELFVSRLVAIIY
jgi:exportin-2 (importin alpha re-exporter)